MLPPPHPLNTHTTPPHPPTHSQACTAKMNLSEEVDLEDYVARPDKINNAEIASICQASGGVCVRACMQCMPGEAALWRHCVCARDLRARVRAGR